MVNLLMTLVGVFLIAVGVQTLYCTFKSSKGVITQHSEIPNHVLERVKKINENKIDISKKVIPPPPGSSVSWSVGSAIDPLSPIGAAVRVEGFDQFLSNLQSWGHDGEYVRVEDTKTKHQYWIKKIK